MGAFLYFYISGYPMETTGMTADFDCYKSKVKSGELVHIGSFQFQRRVDISVKSN